MNKKSYLENTQRKQQLTIALLAAHDNGLSTQDVQNLLSVSNSTALRYVKELGAIAVNNHNGTALGNSYIKWTLQPTIAMIEYAKAILNFDASKVQE